MRHIQNDYVEEPNLASVTNGALRGLLESLDADSSYLTPDDYKLYKAWTRAARRRSGSMSRSGLGTRPWFRLCREVRRTRRSLVDGDIIEAIDGQDTRDIPLAMIQKMLEGPPGAQVTVSVVRPRKAEPDKIVMTRTIATHAQPVAG